MLRQTWLGLVSVCVRLVDRFNFNVNFLSRSENCYWTILFRYFGRHWHQNRIDKMKNNNRKSPADQQLDERLASLDAHLEKTRKSNVKKTEPQTGNPGYGNAFKMSSEFIAAILVGATIGYLIDALAGTTPWAMIIMLLLGFVAGVFNVLRSSGEMADPYSSDFAKSSKGTRGHEVADKASEDLYDEDDE